MKKGLLAINGLDINKVQRWAGIVVTLDEYLLNRSTAHIYSSDNGIALGKLNTFPIRNYFLRRCRKKIDKSKHISWKDVQGFPEEHIEIVSSDVFEQQLAATTSGHSRLFDIVLGNSPPLVNAMQLVHPILGGQFNSYLGSVSLMEEE